MHFCLVLLPKYFLSAYLLSTFFHLQYSSCYSKCQNLLFLHHWQLNNTYYCCIYYSHLCHYWIVLCHNFHYCLCHRLPVCHLVVHDNCRDHCHDNYMGVGCNRYWKTDVVESVCRQSDIFYNQIRNDNNYSNCSNNHCNYKLFASCTYVPDWNDIQRMSKNLYHINIWHIVDD